MARQIIITEIELAQNGNDFTVRGVFWLTAPANKKKPLPNLVSRIPLASVVSWGVTTAELADLQAGNVVEQSFDTGQLGGGTTRAAAQATLVTMYNAAQAALTATNPAAKFIGAYFDGTSWTQAP